jgi:transcriptional regulator with XRE-family HTH domain
MRRGITLNWPFVTIRSPSVFFVEPECWYSLSVVPRQSGTRFCFEEVAMLYTGRALKRLRLVRGIKQSHVAELLNVTQATVSRWETGVLMPAEDQRAALESLFASPASTADTAIKRLVETSTARVHLICDHSHRLLAASPARRMEWRRDMLGAPMFGYASEGIQRAERTLEDLGWHEGQRSSLIVETGPNGRDDVPILAGRVLWERIPLADGAMGRLVTTLR